MILRTGFHVSCDSDSQIFADPTGPEMPPFSGVVGDRGAAPAAGRAWGARQPARGNKSLQHLTKMARRWVSQGLQRCNSPIPANCGTPGHLMIARSTASEIPPTHPSGIIPEHPGSSRKGGPLLLQVCGRSSRGLRSTAAPPPPLRCDCSDESERRPAFATGPVLFRVSRGGWCRRPERPPRTVATPRKRGAREQFAISAFRAPRLCFSSQTRPFLL